MSAVLVIDAIVRQTTVLIAQLATSAGMRAPVAHIANQTFLSLTRELGRQGLPQKVIADMFGLALRSYQQKVRRLSESATDRDRTLWQAVHDHLGEVEVASRADVLKRFARDDEASVRGILSDMVDSGLLYKTGRGAATVYRSASVEEIARASRAQRDAARQALVWLTVYRHGPMTLDGVCEQIGIDAQAARTALHTLVAGGQIETVDAAPTDATPTSYRSSRCLIPQSDDASWEVAFLDHYQAMVAAMCAKLSASDEPSLRDKIGGSTYSFDVWPEHPHAARVYGLLAAHRAELSALWDEVSASAATAPPDAVRTRVTFYFGQLIKSDRQGHGSDATVEERNKP